MAVVEAVRLKGKDKGPRLFCTAEFYENLTDEESRQIVIPTESKDIYEILWVMPYIKESPSGINECREMLEISLNLWQYFNHKDFGVHYFRFLELVVRSILESYKNSDDDFKRAIDTIIAIFENKHEDIRKISHILDRYKR